MPKDFSNLKSQDSPQPLGLNYIENLFGKLCYCLIVDKPIPEDLWEELHDIPTFLIPEKFFSMQYLINVVDAPAERQKSMKVILTRMLTNKES